MTNVSEIIIFGKNRISNFCSRLKQQHLKWKLPCVTKPFFIKVFINPNPYDTCITIIFIRKLDGKSREAAYTD